MPSAFRPGRGNPDCLFERSVLFASDTELPD